MSQMINDEILLISQPCELIEGTVPIASSAASNCEGFMVEGYAITGREPTPKFAYIGCHAVSIQREGICEAQGTTVGPGELVICAAGEEQASYTFRQSRNIVALLSLSFIKRAVRDAINLDSRQVVSNPVTRDEQVERLLLSAESEIRTGMAGGRMLIESLGTALAIQLLTHHASKRTTSREYGAMPKYLLRRAIEFIHENLGKNLSLFELAAEVDMSPYHFCRLFKQSMGLSPHQYVQRERIRRAQDLLAEHRLSVAEIAGEMGFSDQSHFSRTFSRGVGATPREYANAHFSAKRNVKIAKSKVRRI